MATTHNEHPRYRLSRLEVVTVSDEAKQLLLQDPMRSSRSRMSETKGILSRLKTLHDPTSQAFVLKERGVTSVPFRLLCETPRTAQKN
jgi:hypothetical protein